MLTSVLRGMAGATRALVPLSAPTPAHGDEKTAKKQQGQEGSRNNEEKATAMKAHSQPLERILMSVA